MDRDAPFTTKDLDLAAYLATEDLKPARLQPPPKYSGDSFVTLVYEPSESLFQALDRWRDDEPLPVDLRQFLEARYGLYERMKRVRGGEGR